MKHPITLDIRVGIGNFEKFNMGIWDNINLTILPNPPPIKTNKNCFMKRLTFSIQEEY